MRGRAPHEISSPITSLAKTVADVEVENRQAADKASKSAPAKEDDPNYN
jgi:hypothetical protein